MLERGGYRDLKIVDIAREAGTSPATFYQYFPDVEGALTVLAGQMAEDGRQRLPASVTGRPWEPGSAYDSTFFSFWEDHRPLMRVIDLAAAEGNPQIRGMRMGMMNEFARALATVVDGAVAAGDLPAETDSLAVASVVVTLLVNVAIQRYQFEFHNISSTSVDEAVRRMVFTALTGRLVADPGA
jgi:AcrR family transcriptional regulator